MSDNDDRVKELEEKLASLLLEIKTLKNPAKPSSNIEEDSPLGILKGIASKIYKEEKTSNSWQDSVLEELDKLKNDCSGKSGELLIEHFCKAGNIPHTYNCDINSKDGTYDIIIKDKKVEIKTAKLGKQKTFQHESLRSAGYDYLLFLDICPSYYYITIIPKFDLNKKSEILGRKAHLRKGTDDVFKLDTSEKIITSLIDKGFSIKVSDKTLFKDVIEFIGNKITD